MQSLSILFMAMLLDYIIGDPRTKYHPVCLMGNFAYGLEKYVRRGPNTYHMLIRGGLAWLCVILLFSIVTWSLVQLAAFFGGSMGEYVICVFILSLCMAPKSLSQHAKNIVIPLKNNDIPTARQQLSLIVGRDVQHLDAHGIARASIESVGENLVDGVLASLFWASIGLYWGYGEAAVFVVIHRASNVLDAQWGKKNEKYLRFGTCSARVDDILNYIPARLALLCICLTGAVAHMLWQKTWSTGNITKIFRVAWTYKYAHASPNSAWSEAAFASVLDLSLGGPVSYAGQAVNYPRIGQGTSFATTQHMEKAIQLLWSSTYVWLMGTSGMFYIFSYFLGR